MRDLVPSRDSEPLLGPSAAERRPKNPGETRLGATENTPPARFPWIPLSPLL